VAWGSDEIMPLRALQEVATYFQLGHVEDSAWAGGYSNKNYLVTTEFGEFFIKFVWNPRGDIAREITYLKRLKQYAFPAGYYLASPQGSFVWQGEDGRQAVVQKKITGQVAVKNTATACMVGYHLARLHTLPFDDLPATNSDLQYDYVRQSLITASVAFNEQMLRPLLIAAERLANFPLQHLPRSIVHGDLTRHNCLFQGDALVAIVDWEEVGVSAALLDIAVAMLSWCYRYRDDNQVSLVPEWYDSFLTGYRQVRSLLPIEEEHLAAAVQYAALTMSLWGLLQFGIYYPDQSQLQGWLSPVLE